MQFVTDAILHQEGQQSHHAGSLTFPVLRRIEELLPTPLNHTAETGCGRSTILFSNLSQNHSVFCLDDLHVGETSSVSFFQQSSLFQEKNVTCHFGPTQITLARFDHQQPYDCVLLDGPHAYPFLDLEYYHFYPHIRKGGLLIIDDVHIASIGRMADILQEDDMWDLIELAGTTAIFQRTQAPTLSTSGDGWWKQGYNTRRAPFDPKVFLADDGKLPGFEDRLSGEKRKEPISPFRKIRRMGRKTLKKLVGH